MAIDNTRQLIQQITNATQVGENSASRVGGAMNAMLNDVESNKTSIDTLLTQMGGSKTFALTEGGLFTKSGAWESMTVATVHCTGYVDVRQYSHLTAVTSIGSSAYAVAFFDSDKNLLPDISIGGGGGVRTHEIDLTAAAYANVAYAFVSAYDSNADFSAYSLTCEAAGAINARLAAIDDRLGEAESDISGIGAQIDGIDSTVASLDIKIGSEGGERSAELTETGFCTNTGAYVSTSNAMNTGLVSIDGYRVVKYKSSIGTGAALLAFYDASQNFLPSLVVEGTGQQVEGTIILEL